MSCVRQISCVPVNFLAVRWHFLRLPNFFKFHRSARNWKGARNFTGPQEILPRRKKFDESKEFYENARNSGEDIRGRNTQEHNKFNSYNRTGEIFEEDAKNLHWVASTVEFSNATATREHFQAPRQPQHLCQSQIQSMTKGVGRRETAMDVEPVTVENWYMGLIRRVPSRSAPSAN